MDDTDAAVLAEVKQSLVLCRSSQGVDLRATLLRFTRHSAAFEVYAPSAILRTSEVLSDFRIVLDDQTVYSGRAVIVSLVNAGETLVCEVTLDDHWINIPMTAGDGEDRLLPRFGAFLREWQKTYKVLPEFKVVVADMRSLLGDLRLWLDQIELSIRSTPNGDRQEMEVAAARELAPSVLEAIDSLGDRFEQIAATLDPELRPAHICFTRRNLHSLLLCSPFSYRTFHKPLGYAGDYEMVNMILRLPYEGSSLFAKLVNAWFLNQLPAQAHRNRIVFLKTRLSEEIARMAATGRTSRVFNLGCGPASEIQEFLAESDLSNRAEFTLLDFNEETIQHASRFLKDLCSRYDRTTAIQMQRRSVQQLLKEAAKPGSASADGRYDFLYCAGLFDYLPDRVCKQLMGVFYRWLAPGGLLLVSNVDGTRPFRNKLEFILDWNLIYRTGRQLSGLAPESVPSECCSVKSDWTSVNVLLEIRKPVHA